MWEELQEPIVVLRFALADPEFEVGEQVTVEAVRIQFDEIDGVIDFKQFQQQTQGTVFAQLPQVVNPGIETIPRTHKWIEEATKGGHGLEDQYRKFLLRHPQTGGKPSNPAAHDDAVIIRQCSLLFTHLSIIISDEYP
jgi:hypothetical protein